MQEYMSSLAKNVYELDKAELSPDKNEKGQKMPNVGRFMIQVQQAKKFVNEKLSTVVIGDSAATPHPHSGSGLNTGVAELDGLGALVESLRQQKLMSVMEKRTGKSQSTQEEKAHNRSTAFDAFNQEMKGWTDKLVSKALSAMKTVYYQKVRAVVNPWPTKYAQLPTIGAITEKATAYKDEALKIYQDTSTDRETLVNRLLDMLEEAIQLTKEYDGDLLGQQHDEYMRERVDEI